VIAALVEGLKRRGCEPFLVPAMGSHGGATPAGQETALERLGITQQTVGATIHSQGGVLEVARTDSGLPVFADRLAVSADFIIPVNRIYTHTNFSARVESGLLKMLAVGLGKRQAAESAHRAALGRGLGEVILEVGRKALAALSVPFGLAIVENARRQVARIAAIPGESLEAGEADLLQEAKALKPRIPFDFLHLLVVDRMGKNISGTGMDTKVIGRMHQTGEAEPVTPRYQRIYVRDLSPETGGNAHGMGLADFISSRLAEKIDTEATLANGLSACAPQRGRRPPVVASDREGIALGWSTSGGDDPSQARIVRIASTGELERLWISEPLREEAEQAGLLIESDASPLSFDAAGNLPASF
ncbi:MAG: DUF2088 domain-containing protein, partial [Acidobacteria bacterium]|nr:DUF2088 domain-containing protein [Acidobacteriota bacterium]